MARALPSKGSGDVIVARATAAGDGAIAIVRASGPGARAMSNRVFHPVQKDPDDPGRLVLGHVHACDDRAARIDQGMRVCWIAPNSVTGEDVVEFHLHGSSAVVAHLIDEWLRAGARLAEPGEFTRRAYLNGKIDLAQAEAVCDLVRARTDAAGRAALQQLSGGLSRHLDQQRAALVPVIAELEAHIDFPEEGLEFATRERLGRVVDHVARALQDLLDGARIGRRLRDGVRVVLAGPPNAGKSSLFNLLLRRERALVTPHAGTTRDTIEVEIDLRGVPVTLVDTAGLRAAPEEIEALGIARTREELAGADLVLFMVDASDPNAAREEYAALGKREHLLILNKSDRVQEGDLARVREMFQASGRKGAITLSTTERDGFDDLEARLISMLGGGERGESGVLVTNQRHVTAIDRAVRSLYTVGEGLASELSPEFLVVDLTEAIAALDTITGRATLDEDVLDAIFSTFCLGK